MALGPVIQGQDVYVPFTATDRNGALTNLTAAVATIEAPDGSFITPAPSILNGGIVYTGSTGSYYFVVSCTVWVSDPTADDPTTTGLPYEWRVNGVATWNAVTQGKIVVIKDLAT